MYLVFITFHLLAFCIISECSNSVTDTPMQQAGLVLSTMQFLNKCDFHWKYKWFIKDPATVKTGWKNSALHHRNKYNFRTYSNRQQLF